MNVPPRFRFLSVVPGTLISALRLQGRAPAPAPPLASAGRWASRDTRAPLARARTGLQAPVLRVVRVALLESAPAAVDGGRAPRAPAPARPLLAPPGGPRVVLVRDTVVVSLGGVPRREEALDALRGVRPRFVLAGV